MGSFAIVLGSKPAGITFCGHRLGDPSIARRLPDDHAVAAGALYHVSALIGARGCSKLLDGPRLQMAPDRTIDRLRVEPAGVALEIGRWRAPTASNPRRLAAGRQQAEARRIVGVPGWNGS